MSRRPTVFPALLALWLGVVAAAAGALEQAAAAASGTPRLEVGAPPPTGFELASITGERYDLFATASDRSLLLVFFRGVW